MGLKDPIKETMADYGTDDTITAAWDDIQTEYECCGVDGPDDWDIAGVDDLPDSCCSWQEDPVTCKQDTSRLSGCFTKFEDLIAQNEHLIFAIVSLTLISLVVSAALAIMMYCAIR